MIPQFFSYIEHRQRCMNDVEGKMGFLVNKKTNLITKEKYCTHM